MIDTLAIDRWSSMGDSWLHRASAPAKLVATLGIVGVLVVSREAAPLGFVYAVLLGVLLTSRLSLLAVLGLSLLPVTMSAVFAITRIGTTWESALVIIEKGSITSLTLLLLVSSTPSTHLFAVMRRAMPATLAEILFLAYRSMFILLSRALAAWDAVRLRDVSRSRLLRLKRGGVVGALAVLRGTELASEQYTAMRLRGFGGTAGARTPVTWRGRWDAFLLCGVGLTVVGALGPAAHIAQEIHAVMAAAVVGVALFARGSS